MKTRRQFLYGVLSAVISGLPVASLADTTANNKLPSLVPEKGDNKVLYKYVCPMHPQIVRDHPGTCPICGMKLVKQLFKASEQAPKISVSQGGVSGTKQGFAIRTAKVQKTTLWKYIPTFGKVVADESKAVHIHPRASGWISDLAVRSNGESIKKGQLLYRIYSPEIVSAQQDLLLAIQNRKRIGKAANSLVKSAEIRLSLLGLDKSVIRQIERRGDTINQVPIYAPQNGVVSNLIVQDGMYVQPQTELMNVADLSTVWVEAEVLPLQQSWIKDGLTADISTNAFPKRTWESVIDYIYPVTDTASQALKVRLPVENKDLSLKPNMFVDVAIYGGPKRNTLAIPLSAVIDDGHEKRVVKELDNGEFQVVKVVTGMETQGIVEIYSGLEEGDRIVVSGQFLLDSESQIQSNLRKLMFSGHQHK
ncbi:efflux RND transporter periplasmic adaptor subunit [Hydrogenovibrio kuenenii]|uniref:efflux RND transporter periplasmic adaptor subunit n=1 Tax=Hydrogenovibrio kuenenii TaxID=63658 RepID=UPI0004671058|nr:efflux RND transporter periplasmic adaptor subunit [Hydrogenovibrio kuenenii]